MHGPAGRRPDRSAPCSTSSDREQDEEIEDGEARTAASPRGRLGVRHSCQDSATIMRAAGHRERAP